MNKEDFQEDLMNELENLKRLNDEMRQLLEEIGDSPSFIEIRAAGSILHDFYSGVEKIFERIAVNIDHSLPEGENWHMELLLQMTKPYQDMRDAIISEGLCNDLKEYLRFRHLFRHIYGFEIKWERFGVLCQRLEGIFITFKTEIESFISAILNDGVDGDTDR
ncbi:MAG: hypothetical protein HZA09_07610 [Nitrospirae bacterium]|nr:hypothetical protein [Nitrospirota bacterium]